MADHREELEIEAEEALEQANPAAVAIALGRTSHGGREVDAEATSFLRKQSRLTDLQMENLHEQRDLQLAHLKVRRWKDRLSIAAQALGIGVGAAAVIALGTLVWQAHEDHGLVVEAFSVPPDLAQRGLTGQVAAVKVLDKLATLQAQTDSARAQGTYTNNWGDDIKVEIPDTGVSIGQLNQYLRRWLGHQTHITGEVVRTPAGLAVTARTEADPGATFEGPESGLDKLFQQAAEAVYRRTQPYRYGVWLLSSGKRDQARQVFQDLLASDQLEERKWAEVGLSNVSLFSGEVATAERMHVDMDRRYPDFVMAVTNVTGDALILDHEEEVLDSSRRSLPLFPGGLNRQVTPIAARSMAKGAESSIAEALGDFREGARMEKQEADLPDYGGSRTSALFAGAADLAYEHQTAACEATLAGVNPPTGAAVPAGFIEGFNVQAAATRMLCKVALEDWPAVISDGMQAMSLAHGSTAPFSKFLTDRQVLPWMAYAKARAGDQAGAEALIAQTPTDADTALRLRGKIAAAKRDWAGAGFWFAKAVRQAPSIPFAYTDWGEMLLAKGDVAGAIAKLEIAHAKGPHFADALELWGEGLMRKGDFAGAAGKFAEAGKNAPGWQRNRQLWRQALAKAKTHG